MEFGTITTGIDATMEEKLDRVKAWGMTVWHPAAPRLAKEDLSRVKDLVAERGLGVSALSAGVRMSHPDKKEANLRDWDGRIEMATTLGIEAIVSRTFPKPEGVSDEDAWKACVELGKEMASRCADNGCVFALETDHFNFVETLDGSKRLLAEVDHPAMKINFDPCNFYFGGSEPSEVIDALFDHIVHGHIKDAVRVEGQPTREAPVGEGDLDYAEILGELSRRGFKGAMCIEHCKDFDCIEAAWKHIQSVRAQVGL